MQDRIRGRILLTGFRLGDTIRMSIGTSSVNAEDELYSARRLGGIDLSSAVPTSLLVDDLIYALKQVQNQRDSSRFREPLTS